MNKWFVIKKGNGRFYPRIKGDSFGEYWPYFSGLDGYDTLEEAKGVLVKQRDELKRIEDERKETVVFELE